MTSRSASSMRSPPPFRSTVARPMSVRVSGIATASGPGRRSRRARAQCGCRHVPRQGARPRPLRVLPARRRTRGAPHALTHESPGPVREHRGQTRAVTGYSFGDGDLAAERLHVLDRSSRRRRTRSSIRYRSHRRGWRISGADRGPRPHDSSRALPGAEVTGIDTSEAFLAAARMPCPRPGSSPPMSPARSRARRTTSCTRASCSRTSRTSAPRSGRGPTPSRPAACSCSRRPSTSRAPTPGSRGTKPCPTPGWPAPARTSTRAATSPPRSHPTSRSSSTASSTSTSPPVKPPRCSGATSRRGAPRRSTRA